MFFNITIKNFLNKEECDEIIKTYNHDLYDAKIDKDIVNNDYRKSQVKYYNIQNLKDRLQIKLKDELVFKNAEINELGDFQFTKYDEGGFYKWHTDYGVHNKSRYISTVILLNDSYEGGDLHYKNVHGDELIFERGVGNLFIFNSSTPHMVSTITSGTRYSLVNWVGISQSNFTKSLL